jgi:hypothetical protein
MKPPIVKLNLADHTTGTTLLLGMTLHQHIVAIILLIAKAVLEIITVKALLDIATRTVTPTDLAGDPYIPEEHI